MSRSRWLPQHLPGRPTAVRLPVRAVPADSQAGDELGYPLFVRTARGMRMTDAASASAGRPGPAADAWQQALPQRTARREAEPAGSCALWWAPESTPTGCFRIFVSFFDATGRLTWPLSPRRHATMCRASKPNIDLALDCVLSEDQKTDDLYSCALIWERQVRAHGPGRPQSRSCPPCPFMICRAAP